MTIMSPQYLALSLRHESEGVTCSRHELDLEGIGGMYLHYRTKVALPQVLVREISLEHDGIKFFEHHARLSR